MKAESYRKNCENKSLIFERKTSQAFGSFTSDFVSMLDETRRVLVDLIYKLFLDE